MDVLQTFKEAPFHQEAGRVCHAERVQAHHFGVPGRGQGGKGRQGGKNGRREGRSGSTEVLQEDRQANRKIGRQTGRDGRMEERKEDR